MDTSDAFYKINLYRIVSPQLQKDINKYAGTIFIICIVFIIQRIIGAVLVWYQKNIVARTIVRLDEKLIPFLRRVSKVIVWVIALLVILPL